jgi:hypothetical protein
MLGKRARPVRAGGRWKRTRACGHLADGLPVLLHGCLKDRLFRVEVVLAEAEAVLRIAVTDPKGERRPALRSADYADQFGRGLVIVHAFAARWGVEALTVGKTVWAELELKGCG